MNDFVGKVFPLQRDHVDTDQIIPKQFLKRIERSGFGRYLFYHWRFEDDGKSLRKQFYLDQPKYQEATILLTGHNFGCGSSREHAPWALKDFGFQVIVAKSYADIFYNNCLKNGILPIQLEEDLIQTLTEHESGENSYKITVLLDKQLLRDSRGLQASFEIDPYWKMMLLNGYDEIDLTFEHQNRIKQYEERNEVSALGI
ncbi:3-isopropylmalate dehydratase small subunit [Bacillus sp. 2205SS5-2]|uniref:3-isopropylmalate dehydratase small subunit n=1 Tax=Bacillus sp. 2205SS5-2 TaxID=3109031 RepID=UPI0030076B79